MLGVLGKQSSDLGAIGPIATLIAIKTCVQAGYDRFNNLPLLH